MSNPIHSVQSADTQAQAEQSIQPPKKPQVATQQAISQDTVTVSKASQQALAANSKPGASGDVNHDGDSR
jgi:hypothetical protein